MADPANPQTTPAAPPVEPKLTLGSPEYEAAMAAKGDAALSGTPQADIPPAQSTAPQRPDFVPEKFWDATKGQVRMEDVFKSYSELEKRQSTPPAQQPPTSDPNAAKPADSATKVNATPTQADYKSMVDEFVQNGKLSEETYKKLDTQGIPRNMVDAYIAGQQAIAAQEHTKIFNMVGGQDQYKAMLKWAGSNLNPAEINAYDEVMTSGDFNKIHLAVQGLHAKYSQSRGREAQMLHGDSGVHGSVGGYESKEQMQADMKNPLYRTDPAFRGKVVQKIANTKHELF